MPETLISPTPLDQDHIDALFGPLSSFWCRCRNNILNVDLFVYSHLVISEPRLTVQSSLKNPEDKTYTLFLPEFCRQEDSVKDDLGLSLIQDVLFQIQEITTVLPKRLEQYLLIDTDSYTTGTGKYTYPTLQ